MDRRDFLAAVTAASTGPIAGAHAAETDALIAQGIKIVPTMANLRALVPQQDEVVWLRGYQRPLDGGEGIFVWDADASEPDDTGITITQSYSDNGRWKRQFDDGFINGRWFESIESLFAYISKSKRPITVQLPRGEWDMRNQKIPPGVTFVGTGCYFDSNTDRGGFGDNGTIIKGHPIQPGGPGMNRFVGIVFDGGITINMQFAVFENCCFTGLNGTLSFEGAAAPYYSVVDKCWFRGITGGPCIQLRETANAIHITNSSIFVEPGERGIVAEKVGNRDSPGEITVTNTAIEAHEDNIGSLIYGDFRSSTFSGLYMESKSCTDGAPVVFTKDSRHNNFWIPGPHKTNYRNEGMWNTFHTGMGEAVSTHHDGWDMADWSGIPKVVIGTQGSTSLAPVQDGYGSYFFVIGQNSEGTVLLASSGETINGKPSLTVELGQVYLITVTGQRETRNWTAIKLSS